jgi:hypothetical protein
MSLASASVQPPPTLPTPRPTAAAAWLASLAVHLALALLGYLMLPASPSSSSRMQLTSAGIVLARRTAPKTQYFQDMPIGQELATRAEAMASSAHQVFRPNVEAPSAPAEGSRLAGMLPSEQEMPAVGHLSPAETPPGSGLSVAREDLPLSLAPAAAAGRPRIAVSPEDIAAILAEDAAQPREERPSGPTASLSLFGLPPAVGRSFVLAIDRSQSMGAGGLDVLRAAAQELAQQLSSLTPQQSVQVVAYNDAVVYGTGPHLAAATAEHRAALVAFVAHLPAYGPTEHIRGLLAALKLRPEVLFWLTDGGDPIPDGNQLALVRRLAAGRTQIHCLHFGRGPADERAGFLQRLARDTGGHYRYFQVR